MPDPGRLNGQPVGPWLPDPVACEVCGADVWVTEDAAGQYEDDPAQWGTIRGVYERDPETEAAGPRTVWALKPHACPRAGGRSIGGLIDLQPLADA